jgi:hypothetical protein
MGFLNASDAIIDDFGAGTLGTEEGRSALFSGMQTEGETTEASGDFLEALSELEEKGDTPAQHWPVGPDGSAEAETLRSPARIALTTASQETSIATEPHTLTQDAAQSPGIFGRLIAFFRSLFGLDQPWTLAGALPENSGKSVLAAPLPAVLGNHAGAAAFQLEAGRADHDHLQLRPAQSPEGSRLFGWRPLPLRL